MSDFNSPCQLRKYRPLLLACEAIGWLHMTGKAKADFLQQQGGQKGSYNYKKWDKIESFLWDDLLKWVKDRFCLNERAWPSCLNKFIEEHAGQSNGLLGLLQAGHAMASGIEKNIPEPTSRYLAQDVTHMWLSTAFGYPVRNLLCDPPELLTEQGWKRLLEQINQLLSELQQLGENDYQDSVDNWWHWRNGAVGPDGWLRKAFTSTLAETRLPNNELTLFDQSYVAAALFKSAVAGAVLEGCSFPWSTNDLKQKTYLKQRTRWRLLTVGISADHYEARAVKIGDWTGARAVIDELFDKICKLVEVDLAIGSLLYRDGEICVFSFPGERFGYDEQNYEGGDLRISCWQDWLTKQIDSYARDAKLETPPYCSISEPSRSLVRMTAEIRSAREAMSVPIFRNWQISGQDSSDGHVCPVCLVRRNRSATDKQQPCETCNDRRTHRLRKWLKGEIGSDSIWISEIADANDRVALVTMSLDIEPWLNGTRLDSLRAQSIHEWRKFNPQLKGKPNPIDPDNCFNSLLQYIREKLSGEFCKSDLVLSSLQEGYSKENCWESFFSKIVEDRVEIAENQPDAPYWDNLDDNGRAAWLAHQLFRKLASPGRIYRFWRQAEEFFKDLLAEFREIAAADQNRWRVRRLVIKPGNGSSGKWEDRQTYNGRYGDAPVSLLYREETRTFLTICNLARLLKPEESKDRLRGITLELRADDSVEAQQITVSSVEDCKDELGVYYPVIPLELSPVRFRLLLPLEVASTCVDRAIEAWNEQFARVWDRLPLRIGIVAFPRMTPFQAVIEAVRNIEADMEGREPETWQVAECETREGVTSLTIKPLKDHGRECLKTMPVRFPDGREDVFYPYFAVEDGHVRFPRDFRHPKGRVFRHVRDLQIGDGIIVSPSVISTVFMDSTARRFEPSCPRQLTEWQRMRELWELVTRHAPSQTALCDAWSEIVERRENWRGPDGSWLEGGESAWLDFARAVLHERLEVRGACLETLVEAVEDGLLEWCLEWHMTILKNQVSGGNQ